MHTHSLLWELKPWCHCGLASVPLTSVTQCNPSMTWKHFYRGRGVLQILFNTVEGLIHLLKSLETVSSDCVVATIQMSGDSHLELLHLTAVKLSQEQWVYSRVFHLACRLPARISGCCSGRKTCRQWTGLTDVPKTSTSPASSRVVGLNLPIKIF